MPVPRYSFLTMTIFLATLLSGMAQRIDSLQQKLVHVFVKTFSDNKKDTLVFHQRFRYVAEFIRSDIKHFTVDTTGAYYERLKKNYSERKHNEFSDGRDSTREKYLLELILVNPEEARPWLNELLHYYQQNYFKQDKIITVEDGDVAWFTVLEFLSELYCSYFPNDGSYWYNYGAIYYNRAVYRLNNAGVEDAEDVLKEVVSMMGRATLFMKIGCDLHIHCEYYDKVKDTFENIRKNEIDGR